jgi:hypothetical protein
MFPIQYKNVAYLNLNLLNLFWTIVICNEKTAYKDKRKEINFFDTMILYFMISLYMH